MAASRGARGQSGAAREADILMPERPDSWAMTLSSRVIDALRREGLTIVCAESMTAGLFAGRLTTEAGASEVFLGGAIVYADAAKVELAGVDRALLEKEGGVSAPVARELARGVRERLGADVGVSIVGFAGPNVPAGGELGRIFIALAHWGGLDVHTLHVPGDRARVREAAVDEALRYVLDAAPRVASSRS